MTPARTLLRSLAHLRDTVTNLRQQTHGTLDMSSLTQLRTLMEGCAKDIYLFKQRARNMSPCTTITPSSRPLLPPSFS